ncbi:hypothetical protein QQZ08_004487 [Neonectria magnoliae]|uniref:Uncharacterized protein n=1 Tax=Neonectria magnoliae TaxID=2732573 RepID=A0ABR1I7K7_9HYPO
MTPTTTLDASRQKQQAYPPSPSPAETSSPREDKDNSPSTSSVGASNEPIWIPSNVDSDAEDDRDDGQDFNDSRSDATLPSIDSLAAQSQPRNTIHADSPSKVFDNIDWIPKIFAAHRRKPSNASTDITDIRSRAFYPASGSLSR